MTEMVDAIASWWNLVLVLAVFGFAPGCCLRLIVLAYPRGDPRRKELLAELRAVPRVERPLWVAEQLEVGLFEGLRHRFSEAIRRRRARAEAAKLDKYKEMRERWLESLNNNDGEGTFTAS
ncbi:MAG: hypothetical protein LC808_28610 [Actinobacteria bacterium]|nr:hypothetical protein [Actinomycetota bacterium]